MCVMKSFYGRLFDFDGYVKLEILPYSTHPNEFSLKMPQVYFGIITGDEA